MFEKSIPSMKICRTKRDLKLELESYRKNNYAIGFIPTMGALHKGHLSLIACSEKECDRQVVSIFVNPAQFNDKTDFDKYPRDIKSDLNLLSKTSCSTVFIPSVEEMYTNPNTVEFDFGNLDKVMEGKFRPGHFNGVVQIVTLLFELVMPDKAFFGLKDFQQIAIIKKITHDLSFPIEIVACPIIREKDGLAMSSRNKLLSPVARKQAASIFKILKKSVAFSNTMSVPGIKSWVKEQINHHSALQVEYFEIVDAETLKAVERWDENIKLIGCIAVFADKVRLIDNIMYSR